MKTYREQLAAVQEAIEKAQDNQEFEYEVDGHRRRQKRAALSDLYKREAFLIRMITRESGADIIHGVPK